MKNSVKILKRITMVLALIVVGQFVYLTISSVSGKGTERLEKALVFAGPNRKELEMVLSHYKQGNDRQKYEAACFLIENMPAYFSYNYPQSILDSIAAINDLLLSGETPFSGRLSRVNKFPYDNLDKVYDVHVITSGYLIRNIDLAFKVWREQPWGKYVEFDDFCEYILPYRTKDEPLSDWRTLYYKRFMPLFDSLYQGTDIIEACNLLNKNVAEKKWLYSDRLHVPHLSASYLLDHWVGDCEDMCDVSLYILRALGIPAATDTYLRSPNTIYSHYWPMVLDTTGLWVPCFVFEENSPVRGGTDGRKKGKVYRFAFSEQPDDSFWDQPEENIPSELRNRTLRDVTSDYCSPNEIAIDCNLILPGDRPEWAYLGVFTTSGWVPVASAKMKKGKAVFRNLENDLIYIPLYMKQGKQEIAGFPFQLTEDTCRYLKPQAFDTRMTLYRKYPLINKGCIEGANRPDFSDADTLYAIPKVAAKSNSVSLTSEKPYRYVRYVSDPYFFGNMAELEFFDCEGRLLKGAVISARPSLFKPDYVPENAFDKDPATYFSCTVHLDWTGLAFAEPHTIGSVSFVLVNDDNFIRKGDAYELFFFSGREWVSLGERKATSDALVYNHVPGEALFWLKNKTRGVQEQIFMYKDGKQIFM